MLELFSGTVFLKTIALPAETRSAAAALARTTGRTRWAYIIVLASRCWRAAGDLNMYGDTAGLGGAGADKHICSGRSGFTVLLYVYFSGRTGVVVQVVQHLCGKIVNVHRKLELFLLLYMRARACW